MALACQVNDPLAAALLLAAADNLGVQLVLMNWNLSSITSSSGTNLVLNASTINPPPNSAAAVPRSTSWARAATPARNALWASIFGLPAGPFDQFVVQYAIDPSMFVCGRYPVWVQQCGEPSWWTTAPSSGYPLPPWNANGLQCAGEGLPGYEIFKVPAQLLVDITGRVGGCPSFVACTGRFG